MLKQQSAERSEYKSGQTLLFKFEQASPIDWDTASLSFKVGYESLTTAGWGIGSAQNVINEIRVYKNGKIIEQIRSYNAYALHRDRLFTPYPELKTKGSLMGYNAGSYFLEADGETISPTIQSKFLSGDEFTIPLKVISNLFEQVWTAEELKIELVLASAADAFRVANPQLTEYTLIEPKIFYGCADKELTMPFTKVKTLRFSLDGTDTQTTIDLDGISSLPVQRCMLITRDESFIGDIEESSLRSEAFNYKTIQIRNDFVEYFNQPIKSANELYHHVLKGETSINLDQFTLNLSAIVWEGRQYNSYVELEYKAGRGRFIEVFVEYSS